MANASVTTKQSRLNIRSEPSVTSSIIGKLGKGSAIDVDSSTTVVDGSGYTWVQYGGGWICQKDPNYSYAFVTLNSTAVTTTPAEEVTVPEETTQTVSVDASQLTAALTGSVGNSDIAISAAASQGINGSAVMYDVDKYSATEGDGTVSFRANSPTGARARDSQSDWDRESPQYVQNEYGYPEIDRFDSTSGQYKYNYYMDYDADNLSSDLPSLRTTLNIGIEGRDQLYRQYTEYYNRFKLANPNDALHKTYGHVFFVRPDCNILERYGTEFQLVDGLENNPNFYYAYYKEPELLRQLVDDAGYDHEFMMYLSNKADGFSPKDEYITNDTFGKSYTGHKIAYGKTNIESRTAGEFTVSFTDDRDLHVYTLHKLWTDYISNVFQGTFNPKQEYMEGRILDYVSDVYYIVTAEDGETVIFWTKYYGVFPTNVPSASYAWTANSVLSNPEITITYQYSFKEDFSPLSLVEFNEHSNPSDYTYVPVISSDGYMVNTTWVGAPFIETFNNDLVTPYTFKLRFKKGNV